MPLDEFRRAIEINLIGSFNIIRLFVKAASTLDPLETGERGVVINTASVAAYEGRIGQTAYASPPRAELSLSRCLQRGNLPISA